MILFGNISKTSFRIKRFNRWSGTACLRCAASALCRLQTELLLSVRAAETDP